MKFQRAILTALTLAFASSLPAAFSNGMAATLVLGQPAFNMTIANQGGVSASSMYNPMRLGTDGVRLAVPEYNNHRVLLWNTIPSSNSQPADLVLGQANFASNSVNQGGGVTAATLYRPHCALYVGSKLLVADTYNHRILIWNTLPTSNGQAADVVIGQPNFTSNATNQGGAVGANTFNLPTSIFYSEGKLFVADPFNHRVLIFNSIPTTNNASADLVLGQSSFNSSGAGTSATTLFYPSHISSNGGKVYVTDASNSRVLIWNSLPASNGQAADLVVGQSAMNGGSANQGGSTAANTLGGANHVISDGVSLYVSDPQNNRLVIYSSIPGVNNASADIVLGQTSLTANATGSSASGLSFPYGFDFENGHLWVADNANNRVLCYGCPVATLSPSQTASSSATSTPSNTPIAATSTRTPTSTPSFTTTPSHTATGASSTPSPTTTFSPGNTSLIIPNNKMMGGSQQKFIFLAPCDGSIHLSIVDIRGNLVDVLYDGTEQAGKPVQITWNGLDRFGKACASGVYYALLRDCQGNVTRKTFVIIQ